jgi:hypothetical protein
MVGRIELGKAMVLRYRSERRQTWTLVHVEAVIADAVVLRFGDTRVTIPRGETKAFLYRPTTEREIYFVIRYLGRASDGRVRLKAVASR